jgi:glycine dehydrogenase subunit 2
MIEPTETESRETLDTFVEAMLAIVHEAAEDPDVLRSAPHGRPVGRLDEVRAVRNPVVRHPFDTT